MRVTYKDIARVAKVDVSTVSLAINRHPRIPEKTRNRILRVAEELGYRPDPAVSSLAAGRWQQRKDYRGLTLAMVFDPRDRLEQEWQLYAQGARARAERIGYSVDLFPITEYPSTDRLLQVLRQRGIRGLILVQSSHDYPAELQDETVLPAVHCGYLRPVTTDVVMPNLLSAVRLAWRRARAVFAQVDFFLPHDRNFDSARILQSTARMLIDEDGSQADPPRIVTEPEEIGRLAQESAKTSAIITSDDKCARTLRESGVPQGIRIIPLHSLPPHSAVPAVDLQLEKVGAAAVDFLELKIRRVPLGEHSSRQSLMIDPVWIAGEQEPARQA